MYAHACGNTCLSKSSAAGTGLEVELSIPSMVPWMTFPTWLVPRDNWKWF